MIKLSRDRSDYGRSRMDKGGMTYLQVIRFLLRDSVGLFRLTLCGQGPRGYVLQWCSKEQQWGLPCVEENVLDKARNRVGSFFRFKKQRIFLSGLEDNTYFCRSTRSLLCHRGFFFYFLDIP